MIDNQPANGANGGYGVRMLIFFCVKSGSKVTQYTDALKKILLQKLLAEQKCICFVSEMGAK
jgi:hypothetical protein